MSKRIAILSLFVATLLIIMDHSAQQQPSITGTFENFRMSSETGDLLGMGVILLASNGADTSQLYALVQEAEGALTRPFLVKAKFEGNNVVSFTFPGPRKRVFRGEVFDDSLAGSFEGERERIILKRAPTSFWP